MLSGDEPSIGWTDPTRATAHRTRPDDGGQPGQRLARRRIELRLVAELRQGTLKRRDLVRQLASGRAIALVLEAKALVRLAKSFELDRADGARAQTNEQRDGDDADKGRKASPL